ncbi:methylated-DNA--[protein]-cysteine S-methyltransferase [Pseudohoeflea suaedae]|uniref:Methylated-DNA--[protein]-cysteine S-methyltransferase n=1 Tax=Pseudohoeflea suaedae TaxID=877384 RepID=A0A4R5PII1_9HYPH|nr:methylated-DNA--[protein]-cysteine S-methyltransferase [Pseudohoeflea suaedae]TDH35037.1 methylated-DNA--[protein]-cysteine S-methyltransferase [Pseudohoeflea suaedae]
MRSFSADHRHLFETDFGLCEIGWTDAGISDFRLPTDDPDMDRSRMMRQSSQPPRFIVESTRAVRNYFAGIRTDFADVPVDLSGLGDFERDILLATRRIGWGDVSSYGVLARELTGDVGVSRAVGQALGRNPVPLIIPCHRVLAADGAIGGFSAPGGTVTKLRMLEIEGALAKSPVLAQRSFGF